MKKVRSTETFISNIVVLNWVKHSFYPCNFQKQPPRGVLKKKFSENMQQIYRRTPMLKCDFNKVALEIALHHGCSPVNLLHIFRTPFSKKTFGGMLL